MHKLAFTDWIGGPASNVWQLERPAQSSVAGSNAPARRALESRQTRAIHAEERLQSPDNPALKPTEPSRTHIRYDSH